MPHPDEGLIHAWLDRELDAAEAARVEALVASDPEWAVAAMEARGLLAASARIVGALDRVPANVMPRTAAPRRPARRWVWRAAAVVALMAGSAVVLERGKPELTAPAQVKAPAMERDASPATRATSPAADAPTTDSRSTSNYKELAVPKQRDSVREKVTARSVDAATLGGARANAAGEGLHPPVAAPPPAAAATPAQAQAFVKTTRLQPTCFLQREPSDSNPRMIRLDAVALADSIRLERLTLRGDTLSAVHGRFTAVRVPCPEP